MRWMILVAAIAMRAYAAPIAITIDDLPFTGPLAPNEAREAAIGRMLDAAAGVPVAGFVTCGNIARGGRDLLRWLDGGITVGNHSTAHRAIDDLPLDAWRRDIEGCQARVSREAGAPVRYFRYPFLRSGADRARRDAGAAVLRDMGLTVVPVTIDTSEWTLTAPYVAALRAGDRQLASSIADAYVEHVLRAVRHHLRVAREVGAGDAPQILLLHANALAADRLGQVLERLRHDGHRFVALDEALRDPLYAREDRYAGRIGMSWLLRVREGGETGWAWDAAQQHALAVRFGGEPEHERFDLDVDLSLRRIQDGAWEITHARPVSSNQLLVRMADGSLVLMHTPWSDEATRSLLDWVRARFGPANIIAIAAHFHADAVAGAQALIDDGARWIGSDHTARLMRERSAELGSMLRRLYGEGFASYAPPIPRETFVERDGLTLRFGGEEARLIYPGPAHAPDTIVVYFPSRHLLFGGCAVVGMERFGYLGDADLASWPRAIERMRALGATMIVPGHGDRLDPDMLDHTLDLIRERAQH